jgi:sporulation protein YlmC with PRC-barrel domain
MISIIYILIIFYVNGETMEGNGIPKIEEKLWSEVKGYQVATNNAIVLGKLEELIINEKNGKIVDIAIRVDSGRKISVKGARRVEDSDLLLVPFAKVEKVGEFIIVSE